MQNRTFWSIRVRAKRKENEHFQQVRKYLSSVGVEIEYELTERFKEYSQKNREHIVFGVNMRTAYTHTHTSERTYAREHSCSFVYTINQYRLDISILIQLDAFIGNRIAQANNNFVHI